MCRRVRDSGGECDPDCGNRSTPEFSHPEWQLLFQPGMVKNCVHHIVNCADYGIWIL
jgi:hypothetical protein